MLARIKGASENRIMFRHVFRNAFVPMAQYIPTSFLNTVIGSIYVESLFSIPGMGGLLVDVVKKQDNAMVQSIVLLFACVGVIGLLLGDLMMVALDAGAEDVSEEDGIFEVTTGPTEFAAVCAALEEAGFTFDNAEISMIPQNTVAIDGEKLETFEKMIDMLEDNDDVQNVYHNAEIAE